MNVELTVIFFGILQKHVILLTKIPGHFGNVKVLKFEYQIYIYIYVVTLKSETKFFFLCIIQ